VGQVLGLIQKTAAQTSGIHLLQPHDIVLSHDSGNPIQIQLAFPVRQYVFPALGEVLTKMLSINTGLYVVAEQADPLMVFLLFQALPPFPPVQRLGSIPSDQVKIRCH
jgi:hypothetical protein